MKGKLRPKNISKDIRLKNTSANFFLDTAIIFLSAIIVYMSYSLFAMINTKDQANVELKKKPIPAVIQVEVLNGSGVSGIADKITDYLRLHRFDVVQIGNYISYDVEKSIVIDRTGNMVNAFKIADSLGISRKNVIQQVNNNYILDVSLIIGKDFVALKPYQ